MRKAVLSLLVTIAFAANAEATSISYRAFLTGPGESPPNSSPGTGLALVVFDDVARTLTISANFLGLVAPSTAAHIHCCTTVPFAGTAAVVVTPVTLPGFPLSVTSGTYFMVLDTTLSSTYAAAFITANGGTTAGAQAALISGFNTGRAYFNIHSTTFPGGEIRGFLEPVPEPATLGLVAIGLAGAAVWRRRRTR